MMMGIQTQEEDGVNNNCRCEVFTLPHVVRPDTSGQQCHQNPNFLVKFSLIFRSLSSPNSTHFLTRQFVCRTVQWTSLERTSNGADKDWTRTGIITVIVIN